MSSSISERPLGRDRKCFSRKVMRLFYVPFVDPTEARKVLVLPKPNRVDGGTARAAPELPRPPCDRGTGRRHFRRTAQGPPERLTRPEGAVVLARRTVLRSSIARVRLAAIPPVKVASMPHGGRAAILSQGSRLSWNRVVRRCMPTGTERLRATPRKVRVEGASGAPMGSRVDERRDPDPFRCRARRPHGGRATPAPGL
jgi:hypothetical protein